MRVVCRHGHFAFYPSTKAEVQRFMRVFKLAIYAEEDYFTFEALLALPRWSQVGRVFGNLPGVADFEAQKPWEVMRQNMFVFSLAAELLVPLATITQNITISQTLDCSIASRPLVQPGGFFRPPLSPPVRLLSYQGELDLEYQRLYLYSWEEGTV